MQETYIEEILKELTLEEKIGMIHGAGLFRTEGVAIPVYHRYRLSRSHPALK